jgi:hypothetical protein
VEGTEEEMEVSQADDEDEKLSIKPPVEIVESDDTEHDDVEVPPPQRPQEQSMMLTPSKGDDEHGVLRICLKFLHSKMQSYV